MLYNRPEKWDALKPDTLAYLKRRGLLPAYDYIVSKMVGVWEWLDLLGIDLFSSNDYEDQDHPQHFNYMMAYDIAHEAYGAYIALLCATAKNKEAHDDLYGWGKYNVFY